MLDIFKLNRDTFILCLFKSLLYFILYFQILLYSSAQYNFDSIIV